MSDNIDDELRETFFQECNDLLEVLESGLLSLSRGEGDGETVNAIFRATHSIKGGAGAFNLTALVRFAHSFETALDGVRNNSLEPTADVLDIFLRCADTLGDLVNANAEGQDGDASAVDRSVEELKGLVGAEQTSIGEDEPEVEAAAVDFAPLALEIDIDSTAIEDGVNSVAMESALNTLVFKPRASLYERGNETTLILRALAELGDVTVNCVVPDELEFEDPTLKEPALTWRVELSNQVNEDDVSEIFEFVAEDCDLSFEPSLDGQNATEEIEETISPVEADATDAVRASKPLAETDTEEETEPAIPLPTPDKPPAAVPERPSRLEIKANSPKKTIRVDLDRIDGLINLVGELAINQAMLAEQFVGMTSENNTDAADRFDEFKTLTREIQERVMAVRAQPVKSLFQRMTRIVREAATATGKKVRLVPEGEDTEVDATIVERLADPLTHMIRNAVDHGLETSEVRVAANKSPEGVIRLSASHRSGRIVIEVADDGAGINRKKVKEIAIDRGLISLDAQLSDSEIDNLLFLPGFSTSSEVSDLSGRGVGMDVVKRSIQSLGGRTSISSEPGLGTTITISLPLTLAVLDVIVVRIAEQTLVIPIANVVETLNLNEAHSRDFGDQSKVILIRGEPVPIVDVGHILAIRDGPLRVAHCVYIVVETSNGIQSAIPVDEIYDQRQVVMKGLEANYGEVPGIAAATILGNGEVALILDLDSIVDESLKDRSGKHLVMAE